MSAKQRAGIEPASPVWKTGTLPIELPLHTHARACAERESNPPLRHGKAAFSADELPARHLDPEIKWDGKELNLHNRGFSAALYR